MKTIPLTQGKVTLVDDDVYVWASKFEWHAQRQRDGRTFYAARGVWNTQTQNMRTVRLHREILRAKRGLQGHHINGDGLDNRRENLRIVTNQQNHRGFRHKCVEKSSKYRGVHWHEINKKWRACIYLNGHQRRLGDFNDQETAARAYDGATREFFGEFACPNFP